MKRILFITLVSHCEKVWWDSGYESLRLAVGSMVQLQTRVGERIGKPASSTFCTLVDHPTKDTWVADAENVFDLFQESLSYGNEIGLHIHAPVEGLSRGWQDEFIARDTKLVERIGLPRPVTYVAGDWVTTPRTVRYLEGAGFEVDCSVYTLDGSYDKFGVKIDYTRRSDLRPYHPAQHDICESGDSNLVEIPVSGGLFEFAQAGYEKLLPVEERIEARYESLPQGIDVFQVFWHPFDIVTLDGQDNDALLKSGVEPDRGYGVIGTNQQILRPFEEFLTDFGKRQDVGIASSTAASRAWRTQERRGDQENSA